MACGILRYLLVGFWSRYSKLPIVNLSYLAGIGAELEHRDPVLWDDLTPDVLREQILGGIAVALVAVVLC
jgi:hypothetical protein